jgi:outer membrane protein TolC
LLAAACTLNGQTLTFPEALARLKSGDESLAAARALEEQRTYERRAANGLQLPTVEGNARFNYLDAPLAISLDPARALLQALNPQIPPGAIPPLSIGIQGRDFWRANLRVTQPLYTGGKISAAKRAAAEQLRDAAESRRDVEQNLTTDLVRRYFGLQLAEQARELRAGVLKAMKQHSYNARRLFEEGQIARPERLHAEVAEAEAERELRAAEYDVELARTALALLVRDLPNQVRASTPLFLNRDIGPIEQYRAESKTSNPNLLRLEAQKGLAQQGVRAARSEYLPTVAAFGIRELWERDLTVLDPAWVVGFNVQWNFFDGGRKQNQLRAAREQERRVDLLQSKASRQIAARVTQCYQEVEKARDVYLTLEKTQALADENVRVRTRAFEEGFASSLDVVDAQISRQAVGLQRLRSAYKYVVALAELLEASGQSGRFETLLTQADVIVTRMGDQ